MSIYKKQREQIRNMIIQTAVALFKERGYENVSVDEITTSIEIAKGTFYNYFKSKGDLLKYWSAECFTGVDMKSAMNKDRRVRENLGCLFDSFVNAIARERALFTCFIREMGPVELTKPESQGDFDFPKLLAAVIANSCDGAMIMADAFELKTQVLNNAVFTAMVHWVCSDKEMEGLSAHLHQVLEICLYGMFEGGEDDRE